MKINIEIEPHHVIIAIGAVTFLVAWFAFGWAIGHVRL